MHSNRILRFGAALAIVMAPAMTVSCSSSSTDRILAIEAEGVVFVFLYRDDNLNGAFDAATDATLPGVHVDLQMRGALRRIRGGPTDSSSIREFRVPVGRYNARIGSSVPGDSLWALPGAFDFTVAANDSVLTTLPLVFRTVTVTDARVLPDGRKTWVGGTVLNSPSVFGDSTVHVADDQSAIRMTSVRPGLPVIPGDSALFLGRRSQRDGQPVLDVVSVLVRATIAPPTPDSLSTLLASTANDGALDARLAKVFAATVSDTATITGGRRLIVDDGSGILRVVLSPNVNWGQPGQYEPGVVLDITGLLVPDPSAPGTWMLKPRARQDLVILP